MPDLFGVDIAGIINEAMGSQLLPGTLRKRQAAGRDPENPTAPPSIGYGPANNFRGFKEEDSAKSARIAGGDNVDLDQGTVISILGGSLPLGIVPEKGDLVQIEGQEFIILAKRRDPAGAMYECAAEGA